MATVVNNPAMSPAPASPPPIAQLAAPVNSAGPGAAVINYPAFLQLINNQRDSRWLTLEVCREYQRGNCKRSAEECKYAHPPAGIEVNNGRVTCCFDYIKGKCQRTDPPCKYLHPPIHLKEKLVENGRLNLMQKAQVNAMLHSALTQGMLQPVLCDQSLQFVDLSQQQAAPMGYAPMLAAGPSYPNGMISPAGYSIPGGYQMMSPGGVVQAPVEVVGPVQPMATTAPVHVSLAQTSPVSTSARQPDPQPAMVTDNPRIGQTAIKRKFEAPVQLQQTAATVMPPANSVPGPAGVMPVKRSAMGEKAPMIFQTATPPMNAYNYQNYQPQLFTVQPSCIPVPIAGPPATMQRYG